MHISSYNQKVFCYRSEMSVSNECPTSVTDITGHCVDGGPLLFSFSVFRCEKTLQSIQCMSESSD